MAKCQRCSKSLGLLSLRSHCGECEVIVSHEQTVRLAQLREAERAREEQEDAARRNAAMGIAKALKRRIVAGERVFLYESVYLDVDSRVVDEVVCQGFSLGLLHKLGIEGWEVVSAIPRTVGIALTNRSYGSTAGESWGAGVGGNVVGVYAVVRLAATTANCSDRMLFDYVLRHLASLAGSATE